MSEDFELSEREIDIIRLVATGASNKEIAQKLFISPNTVKVHLRNIFGKLNVVSRTEATMVAIRMGWVESPKNDIVSNELIKSNNQSESNELDTSLPGIKRRNWFGVLGFFLILLIAVNIYFFYIRTNAENIDPNANGTSQIQQTQRWQNLSPMPFGIKNMAAIRYEQKFYNFGGVNSEKILDSVSIYDVNEDIWIEGKKMPASLSNIQAVMFGEKIYIPGGISGSGAVTDTLVVYDPREDVWEERSKLPYAVCRYGLVSLEGKIYLFGGWDGNSYKKDVLIYDPLTDTWEKYFEMPQPLADFGIAVMGGGIHILGGQNDDGILLNHQIFSPQRVLDNEDPWSSGTPLPQQRYGMGVSVLADMIYVVGGKNEQNPHLPIIQYLAPSEEWVEIDQPIDDIGAFPAVIPYETRLYVMGGELNSEIKSTNQVFQAVYTILVPVIRQ